ncbi:hypothetical protein CW362_30215 [Streptomyces populi]|uniref:Uncharacterized protein n=1 Tax=Streptomyces populi TaxID=2058924 RepID=A0A2I0SHB4_9ACTN|nr:hypothetical protein CW362_30215 [Streptomyces populi]
MNSAHSDALRFHACLLSENGSPPVIHPRELDETVQLFLIDELERWSDGLLHQLLDVVGVRSPGPRPDAGLPAGAAVRLLATAPYEVREWLSPHSFAPDRAAAVFVRTVVEARRDLRRITSARLLAHSARRTQLLAHLELLATLAVVIRPVMPGWSGLVAEHLGMPRDAHWPPTAAGHRLFVPDAPLRTGLLAYFVVPVSPPSG